MGSRWHLIPFINKDSLHRFNERILHNLLFLLLNSFRLGLCL